MKKSISALIALTMILTATACSDNDVGSGNSESSITSENSGTTSIEQASCGELAEKVMTAVEFPAMMEITQPEMLESIMDFTDFGITEYTVYQQMMSVHLCEVIIVKTDDTSAALDALKQRQSDLIEKLAFYPEQQESANASVVGRKNGYCYLIAHTEAKTAEKELLGFLDKTT